ncbi:MAG TPA: hypothetical protein VFG56_01025, partial [Candidatus Saccharimonadales bacterium]|nr:hypothetical protein [Candidatus Saccharimonadales bacterium]
MPTSTEKLGPAGGPPVRVGPGNHPPLSRAQRREAGRNKSGSRKAAATTPSTVGKAEPSTQSDRPVPKMGFPAFWYGFKKLCKFWGSPPVVPNLSRKERDLLSQAYDEALVEEAQRQEAKRRVEVRERSVDEIRSLTDQLPKLVVAFFNTKGHASTTTTTVHVAATTAEFTRTVVTLVDGNPAEGTCAARLGRNAGETVTTQQLARTISSDEDLRHRDFVTEITRARPSKQGVRLVSADSIVDETSRLTGKDMDRILELL